MAALLALAVAALDWMALWRGWRRLDHLAKPGVMGVLIAWLLDRWLATGVGILGWFLVGACLSLVGDVFLMLPRERFTAGLAAFALAHVAYLVGLWPSATVGPWLLAPGLVLIVASLSLFRRLSRALRTPGRQQLRAPVAAYSLIITAMALAALTTLGNPGWSLQAAGIVALGALSFYLSDALLAWNRFVRPVRAGRLKVRVLYHLGQIALVGGVIVRAAG